MARFKADEVDNYKPAGVGSFFSLANDGDFERVRLMYNNIDDVELFSVHEIEVNGKSYFVNCLREYDQPIDNCPLCAAGNKIQVKMWVPLYIENTGEVKVWERGRTFVSKLQSACRRFNPLVSSIFEVERNGAKGDQNTTYELINVGRDEKTLAELPELPEIGGTIVKELTFDQLQEFVETGSVADLVAQQAEQQKQGQTRNPASDRRPASNTREQVVTRRPQPRTRAAANDGQPRTDAF